MGQHTGRVEGVGLNEVVGAQSAAAVGITPPVSVARAWSAALPIGMEPTRGFDLVGIDERSEHVEGDDGIDIWTTRS